MLRNETVCGLLRRGLSLPTECEYEDPRLKALAAEMATAWQAYDTLREKVWAIASNGLPAEIDKETDGIPV